MISAVKSGAILPVVIVLSTAIMIVGIFALEILSRSSFTLTRNYYQQIAKEAAQAGLVQGSSCLSNSQPDWGTGLTPDSTHPCSGGDANATLYVNGSVTSTFRVTNEVDSFGHPVLHSVGTVAIYRNTTHTGTPFRTYTAQLNTLLYQTEIRGTVDTSPSKAVAQVASGGAHSCALSSGTVYCWGKNEQGQLGRGYFHNHPEIKANGIPTKVEGLDDYNVTQIEVGADSSCALVEPKTESSTNAVYCWGKNDVGQLADGTTENRSSPTKVVGLNGKRIIKIAVGTNWNSPSCAITDETGSTPNLYCWGGGDYGQIGNGSTTHVINTATQVYDPYGIFNTYKVIDVALNGQGTCVARSDGRVYCWGTNTPNSSWNLGLFGEGSGGYNTRTYPSYYGYIPQSSFGNNPVDKIVGGGATFCAIAGGKAYCWGGNAYHVLGVSSSANTTKPTAVYTTSSGSIGIPSDQTVTDIDVDSTTACAIAGGDTYCWGRNTHGQVGIGYTTGDPPGYLDRPRKVLAASGSDYADMETTDIATGFLHACSVTGGSVFCWGNNSWRELLGDDTIDYSSYPHVVANEELKSLYPVDSISAGTDHTCSIINKSVFCWGGNAYGQLGNGSHVNIKIPNQIPDLEDKTATLVAAGDGFSCAVIAKSATNDTIYCWGRGNMGQLGNNTTTSSQSNPVEVSGLPSSSKISSLTAGKNHACAVVNSDVYCWGSNNKRQTHYSSTAVYKKPTKISNSNLNGKTSKISAGTYSTCAIASQYLYCWGSNIQGVIGNGSSSQSYVNVTKITGGAIGSETITDVSVSRAETSPNDTSNDGYEGGPFACVTLSSGGKVVCWGNDYYNQLATPSGSYGFTSTPSASTAGQLSSQALISISAGGYHTCGVTRSIAILCWGRTTDGVIGNNTNGTPLTVDPLRISDYGQINSHYVTAVSAGEDHTCAIADSAIYCWGKNDKGQLGTNDTVAYDVPQIVAAYSTKNSKSVLTGISY